MADRKLLFLCWQNRLRSPTAETVYSNRPGIRARSAGLDPDAVRVITPGMILCADAIFVMEREQRRELYNRFRSELGLKPVFCLDIPDDYERDDPELVMLLTERVSRYEIARLG